MNEKSIKRKKIDLPEIAAKLTIYAKLSNRLGREPSHSELVEEVKRILSEATCEPR